MGKVISRKNRIIIPMILIILLTMFITPIAFAEPGDNALNTGDTGSVFTEQDFTGMQNNVDRTLKDFSNMMQDKNLRPKVGPVMVILAPIIKLVGIVLGLIAVLCILTMMLNTVSDVFCILVSKSPIMSLMKQDGKANQVISQRRILGKGGRQGTAENIRIVDYFSYNALDIILSGMIIVMVVSNQLMPFTFKFLGWTTSLVKGFLMMDLSTPTSLHGLSDTLDNENAYDERIQWQKGNQ